MPSVQVLHSVETIQSALERKGFEELLVTHYKDTPGGEVVVHDDHGRLARGDHDQVMRIVEESDDVDGLWSALDDAKLTRKPLAGKS